MSRIIKVEGFKAFHGKVKIIPANPNFPQMILSGDWLYKPDTHCWYGMGSSFPEEIFKITEVE